MLYTKKPSAYKIYFPWDALRLTAVVKCNIAYYKKRVSSFAISQILSQIYNDRFVIPWNCVSVMDERRRMFYFVLPFIVVLYILWAKYIPMRYCFKYESCSKNFDSVYKTKFWFFLFDTIKKMKKWVCMKIHMGCMFSYCRIFCNLAKSLLHIYV